MILISGATGNLGREVVAQLKTQIPAGDFVVLARDADKAGHFIDQGIAVRIADFDDPDSLSAAFKGIDTFLFVSTTSHDRARQQMRAVDIAAANGIKRIVYTGLAIKDIDTSAVRDLMLSHFQTEDHIRASGMAYTFMRNTMYAEAIPQIAGPKAPSDGIFLPGGDGRVPYALRSEMAEAAANVLLQSGHIGKTYDITGLGSWTYGDVAESLSKQAGRPLRYQDISPAALQQALKAAELPEFMIWLTLGTLRDIKAQQYDLPSDDLANLLGRAPAKLDSMMQVVFPA
ncbi:MAG: SDR family oxidoreductase [Devosia sp.]|nr:SDR family oxidoreductase [Devosia sp.]